MKSRKVKAAAKSKTFMSKKKLKGDIPLNSDDSGSDVDSDSFYHDEIDDFHKKEDEKLSTDDELIGKEDSDSEEEEVLPITDDENDESDDKEFKDDESAEDEDEGLPNADAWGKKKSWYYNADFVDEDRGKSYREKDAEAAKAEEDEALAIQRSLVSGLSSENFQSIYSKFEGSAESSEEEIEETTPDWSTISVPEKMKLLRKTSPEFLPLIAEFKEKMREIKDRIVPILELIKQHKLPSEECENYIQLKYQLLTNFCLNISFYMALKSQGVVLSNHPILKRLSEYKNLLESLKQTDDKLNPEIDIILSKLQIGEEIQFESEDDIENDNATEMSTSGNEQQKAENKSLKKSILKKKIAKQYDTEVEKEISSLYMGMREQQKQVENDDSDEMAVDDSIQPNEDATADEKRTITYQIKKNKGLIPHRKKEYRNPRVRNRMKSKRAIVRRKGQVKGVMRELKRYDGEPTGISTHVVRSIKLK